MAEMIADLLQAEPSGNEMAGTAMTKTMRSMVMLYRNTQSFDAATDCIV
jgi:hypothetical protein